MTAEPHKIPPSMTIGTSHAMLCDTASVLTAISLIATNDNAKLAAATIRQDTAGIVRYTQRIADEFNIESGSSSSCTAGG